MYAPHPFAHDRVDDLLAFIQHHPLGLLVAANAKGETEMALAPFRAYAVGGEIGLATHLASVNPMCPFLSEGGNVQVWFQGPQAYVSSAWYGHANVPTWNYMGVEARGRVRIMAEQELLQELAALTGEHEAPESPVQMHRLPPAMVRGYLPHLVGLVLEEVTMKGIYKLSQNRNQEDHARIVAALEQRGRGQDWAVAQAMRQTGTHNPQ